MSQKKQSAGRRLSTITIDQAIAGASNVLIAVLAARILGVESFGLFGIVFIIYVTGQGISRALVCEPLLIHPVESQERPGDAIGSATALGIGVGLVVAASGLLAGIWDDRLVGPLIILGLSMPFLVLQDLGRYLGFATHRPSFSLVLDVVWLVLMIVAVGIAIAVGAESLTWFIAVWALSGAAAGALVLLEYRSQLRRPSLSWLRETWTYSWRYLISYSAAQGSALIASLGAVAIAGVRALGAIQGTLLVLRPFGLFLSASVAAGVAEVSRITSDRLRVRRHVNMNSGLTILAAFVNMAVLLLVPDHIGRMVLGDTWGPAEPLMLPASVQMVLLASISGPRSAMLGLRAVKTTVRIDVISTGLLIAAMYAGAFVDDALGAFWALAIAQGVVALMWWASYLRHPGEIPEDSVLEDEIDSVPSTTPTGQ